MYEVVATHKAFSPALEQPPLGQRYALLIIGNLTRAAIYHENVSNRNRLHIEKYRSVPAMSREGFRSVVQLSGEPSDPFVDRERQRKREPVSRGCGTVPGAPRTGV